MRFLYLLILPIFPLYADYCIQALTADSSHKKSLFQEAKRGCYQGLNDVRVESRPPYYTLRIGRYGSYHDGVKDLHKVKGCQKSAFLRNCNFQDFQNESLEEKMRIEEPYHILPEIPQKEVSNSTKIEESYPTITKIKTSHPVIPKKTITEVKESYPALPAIEKIKKNIHTTEIKKPSSVLPTIEKTKVITETNKPIHTTTTTVVTTKTVTTTKVVQMPVWDACQKCFAPMYQEE